MERNKKCVAHNMVRGRKGGRETEREREKRGREAERETEARRSQHGARAHAWLIEGGREEGEGGREGGRDGEIDR